MIRKIILVISALILILVAGLSIYLYNSGPEFPPGSNAVIENVVNSKVPDMIRGETGYASNNGVKIWYESIEPDDSVKGSILMIMGIANDAMAWPPKFINAFVKSGYRVIIYDHRGTGMSDWMEDWSEDDPYSLDDMAKDGIEILNELNIDKAHIFGVSLGGMIAQQLVINYPGRVLTLTSMMSSGYIEDPDLPGISMDVIKQLVIITIKYSIFNSEENAIKMHIASRLVLRGDTSYVMNVKSIAQQILYDVRKRNGYNKMSSRQHSAAVSASGSRYDDLKKLTLPVLIIHGTKDPLIPIAHGKKCAEIIPNSTSYWVQGLGHDLPQVYIKSVASRILNFYKNSGKAM